MVLFGGLMGISLALQAIPAITGLIQGVKQKKEGEELANSLDRPTFETPDAYKEAVGIQRDMVAPQALAGAGFTEQQIRSTTGEGIRGLQEVAGDPASLLQTALQLYSNQQEQLGGLGAQQSQFMANQKIGQTGRLQDLLKGQAAYEEKEFEINEFQPYLQAAQAAAALKGAGMQNIQGGLSAMAGGAATAIGDKMQLDMYEKLLGGGNNSPASKGLQSAKGYMSQDFGAGSNNMFGGADMQMLIDLGLIPANANIGGIEG